MSDFAPDAQAATAHAATCTRPAFGLSFSIDLSRRPYFCCFMLRRYPRVFVLRSIAPNGGFLLSHQRHIAAGCSRGARACRGIPAEGRRDVGRSA